MQAFGRLKQVGGGKVLCRTQRPMSETSATCWRARHEPDFSHTPPGGQHSLHTLWMWGSAALRLTGVKHWITLSRAADGPIAEVERAADSEPLQKAPVLKRNGESTLLCKRSAIAKRNIFGKILL